MASGADRCDRSELSWGRRYAAVRPSHFRVDYQINPYMDVDDQPDLRVARAQWERWSRLMRGLVRGWTCSNSGRTRPTWSTR